MVHVSRSIFFAGLFALAALLPPGAAAKAGSLAAAIARGPSSEVDPFAYDASLVRRVPAEFLSEYPGCYLLARNVHRLLADGAELATHHMIVRINTRSGLELLGEWPLWFDACCEEFVLNVARVHKPDGRVVEPEAGEIRLRDEKSAIYQFDAYKYVIVSFPQLETGDVIEVKYTRLRRDPEFAGSLWGRHQFQDGALPVHRSELVVQVPVSKPLMHHASGLDLAPAVSVDGGAATWRWRAENQPPRLVEDSMPHDNRHYPGVWFSTFATWEEVAAAYGALLEDRSDPSTELRALVSAIVGDRSAPLDKAQALCAWVRDQVRYLDAGHEEDANRPHPPSVVLNRRYGNCIDQSHLLKLMLSEAGVPASLVFLNTEGEPQVCHEVPSPEGTHAILQVRIDGREHWVDPTATGTAWNLGRGDLFGRAAWMLDGGTARLVTTPPLQPDQNRTEAETTVTVRLDGSADWAVIRTHYQQAAAGVRERLLAMTPARRPPELLKEFHSFLPRARMRSVHVRHLDEPDEPLRVELRLNAPRQMTEDEAGELLVTVYAASLPAALFADVDPDRRTPLLTKPFELRERVRVRLPAGHAWGAVTDSEEVHSRWGHVAFKATAREHRTRYIEFEWQARLEAAQVAVEDLEAFQDFLDTALDLGGAVVVVERAAADHAQAASAKTGGGAKRISR